MGYVAELNQAGAPRRLPSSNAGAPRRLLRAGELLLKWSEQYGRVLRPKTLLGRFYAPAAADIGDWRLEAGQQWGGESAGDLLTHDLVPQVVTLYTDKIPVKIVAGSKLGRTPSADRTRAVEFRSRFWNFDGEGDTPGYPDSIVPPVLVYADLMATGDARCAAIAERIHRQYVARSFR